jgi:Ca2+-binding RTX toxin-like protein
MRRKVVMPRFVPVAVAISLAALQTAAQASAGTATNTAATLVYEAAPGEGNQLVIRGDHFNGFRVVDTTAPVTAGTGCTSVSVNEVFCRGAPIVLGNTLIHVRLGDLDDSVRILGEADTIRLEGGDGSDDLKGGSTFTNLLDGGSGPDVLRASSPHFGSLDVADYSLRTNPVRVTLMDGLANDGERGEGDLITNGISDVYGGKAGDRMSITRGPSVDLALWGRGGDDKLIARGDWRAFRLGLLLGGADDDTLINATRGDSISLRGAGGNDALQGGVGQDRLAGQAGNDLLFGEGGKDFEFGGEGADLLEGGARYDFMAGGGGPDVFRARDGGRDRVKGGLGRDRARVDRRLDRILEVELIF